MMYKKIFSAMIALSVVVASIPDAQAAFGRSSSSSSSSRSSSSSSYSKSYSSGSSSSASRSSSSNSGFSSSPSQRSNSGSSSSFSGGMSLGKSRQDAVNSVRDGSYKDRGTTYSNSGSYQPSTPSYSNTNRYNNSYGNGYNGGYNSGYNAAPSAPSRFGVGSLAAAAVAGGLVGYMLHSDNHGNTYYTNPNNPGVAYAENGQVLGSVPQGNYNTVGRVGNDGVIQSYNAQAPVQQKSGGFPWGWILLVLVIGGVLFLVFGRKKPTSFGPGLTGGAVPPSAPRSNPEEELSRQMDKFFTDFQKNNRPSQIEWVRSNTTPMMFDAVRDLVESSTENRNVIVRSLSSEIVDVKPENGTYVGSVRYQANVEDDGETQQIDEVWNFLYENGRWKLEGIDQV